MSVIVFLCGVYGALVSLASSVKAFATPTRSRQHAYFLSFPLHTDKQNHRLKGFPLLRRAATALHPDEHSGFSASSSSAERGISELLDWASRRGVFLPDGVSIVADRDDASKGCGVRLTEKADAGTVVLGVPRSLVLSSAYLPDGVDEDTVKDAASVLDAAGVAQYDPEFRLMVRVLAEYAAGPSSDWRPWIASLPSSFSTSLYLDEYEKSYLSPYASALVEFQERQFDAFFRAANLVAKSYPPLSSVFEGGGDDDDREALVRWAFSVVFTRSWRSPSGDEATIVPIGDMLNHREEGDVEVVEGGETDSDSVDSADSEESSRSDGDSVRFVLTGEGKAQSEVHLCYGPHSPANFLAVFGFVDESMSTVPSHVEIPDAENDPKLARLGCGERKKMVYGRDGRVSDAVLDSVLFATLASRPEERDAFFEAVVSGDVAAKAAIHGKYALEVSLSLRSHVDMVLGTYPDPPDPADIDASAIGSTGSHKLLPMVLRYNELMREAYRKVRDRLDEKVKMEQRKRLDLLSSS